MSPVPDLPDVDAIAAAVATCPSVRGLSGGIAGEIATYLPGRRVSGIRTKPGSVEVHVVTRYGSLLHDVDAEVRAAVQAAVPGPLHVDVVLADVEDPFAPPPEPPALEPAGAVPAPPAGSSGASGAPVATGPAVAELPPAGSASSPAGTPTTGTPSSSTTPSSTTTTGTPSTGTPSTGTPSTGPPAAHVPPPPAAP